MEPAEPAEPAKPVKPVEPIEDEPVQAKQAVEEPEVGRASLFMPFGSKTALTRGYLEPYSLPFELF